jgi:hypothetical protein
MINRRGIKQRMGTILLLSLLSAALWIPYAAADTITTTDIFYMNLNYGESVSVSDATNSALITFTVTSGTLKGYGTFSLTSTTGTLSVLCAEAGAVTVTANVTIYAYMNSTGPTDYFTYSAGVTNTWTWTYSASATPTPTATPIVVVDEGDVSSTLYLRSDNQTTNGQTGYQLSSPNTASSVTVSNNLTGAVDVTYGFRVWLVNYSNETIELTPGTPIAQVTRSADGAGLQTASWSPPAYTLDLGFDALMVKVYLNISGTWTSRGTYVTPEMMYTALSADTWTFHLYTIKATDTDTNASFVFGSGTYESKISGLGFTTPTWFELGEYYLTVGNIVGFVFYSYYNIIGGVAYLFIYMIPIGTLYIRHRTTNVILFLFILLGGAPGALAWVLIPSWAAIAVDGLLILIGSFLFWRVIR